MQRPTSVTVFGILNLVFAAFGFVGLLISLVLFFVPENSENHVVKLIHTSPAYAAYLKISIGLGLLACLALLAAGIGLLMLKPWARSLSIVYAIYSILQAIIGTVINYFLLVRPLIEQAQNSSGPEAVSREAQSVALSAVRRPHLPGVAPSSGVTKCGVPPSSLRIPAGNLTLLVR
jgi:hypothetical protein